ncbi:hypothetical protein NQ318_011964 [Aromia moschata]|uniref:Uncharacterized protein n=1 Tax=Aromia moschata TaxID=1265417 RepID=A0AAV8XX62_9CUCU|nr:hypothetical protein NQ318_011964 [Aromia moschata]
MNQRAFLGAGWARGGSSEVVRRAHPASGAQWNVQVVRGKVNGKCLWNACKALSLGLLLMVLGAAMATIGYYADHLSIAQEVRGNHTVKVKNESRGFHLNNLSYAGPIVMGVGGFIVVAACVMTFEARDSAAKVVPARFKLSTTGPPAKSVCAAHGGYSRHGSLRTSASQTGTAVPHSYQHSHCHPPNADRRTLTQSFMHFSRGLALETQHNKNSLKVPQGSINRSPSAPDLILERSGSIEQSSPTLNRSAVSKPSTKPKTFAACALLNPGLLHRHALSVDETAANYRLSNESLHPTGSQGSMAMDLHLECPVTLRVRDRRRNPLKRQRRVDEDVTSQIVDDSSRRSSHSCSPRMQTQCLKDSTTKGGSAHQLPTHYSHCPSFSKRRSSNASDCTHRSRSRRRECPYARGRMERAISSDSRLTGATPRCHHQHSSNQTSTETGPEPGGASSDSDVRHSARPIVQFSPR